MNIEYHISFHMPYIHQKMTSLGLYRARTCFSLIKEHRGDRCHMYRQCRHICVAVKFPRRVANKQQQQQQKKHTKTCMQASVMLRFSSFILQMYRMQNWSCNQAAPLISQSLLKNVASSAVHLQDKKYHIWLMCKSQWSKCFAGGSA